MKENCISKCTKYLHLMRIYGYNKHINGEEVVDNKTDERVYGKMGKYILEKSVS